MNQTCATCRFFECYHQGDDNGICRRYPPAKTPYVVERVPVIMNTFPEVTIRDRCGEWQPKETPAESAQRKLDTAKDGDPVPVTNEEFAALAEKAYREEMERRYPKDRPPQLTRPHMTTEIGRELEDRLRNDETVE